MTTDRPRPSHRFAAHDASLRSPELDRAFRTSATAPSFADRLYAEGSVRLSGTDGMTR